MHIAADAAFRSLKETLPKRGAEAVQAAGRAIAIGPPHEPKSPGAILEEIAPILAGPILKKLKAALAAGRILPPGSLINIRV